MGPIEFGSFHVKIIVILIVFDVLIVKHDNGNQRNQ